MPKGYALASGPSSRSRSGAASWRHVAAKSILFARMVPIPVNATPNYRSHLTHIPDKDLADVPPRLDLEGVALMPLAPQQGSCR